MLDSVAIRAKHNAFQHLLFCLIQAFRKRQIQFLVAVMMELERSVMLFVPTLQAPNTDLMIPKKLVNRLSTRSRLRIFLVALARVSGKPVFPPLGSLNRVISAITLFPVGLLNLFRVTLSPSLIRFALP
jgi:hypothetical protein